MSESNEDTSTPKRKRDLSSPDSQSPNKSKFAIIRKRIRDLYSFDSSHLTRVATHISLVYLIH